MFTATDDCGNATTATRRSRLLIRLLQYLRSHRLHSGVSDEHPMDDASATDNCGERLVEEVTTPGACAGDYTITVRSQLQTTVVMLLQLLRRSRLLIRLLQYLRSHRTTQRSVLTSTQWMTHQRQTTVER